MEKILQLCARDELHGTAANELRSAVAAFQEGGCSWHDLITTAEQHGMSSLLYKHLKNHGVAIPKDARRLLQNLYLRNRRANAARNKAVIEVITAYGEEGIDLLLVKGIALCNFVYSESALRPMRDIDLLVRKSDLEKAQAVLVELGYQAVDEHDIPADYYHLEPMEKVVDGLPVGIELHHNLLPLHPQYPLWPLEKSYSTSRVIQIEESAARTLSLTDTLYYVYLHGFQAPLTYEPYQLKHVADIVTLVENFLDELDWSMVQNEVPELRNSLSRFHFLTPWSEEVIDRLHFVLQPQPRGIGRAFNGWPLRKVRDCRVAELPQLMIETLCPPQWWLQLYYGHLQGYGYWRIRFFILPRTLWRWIKSYYLEWRRNSQGTSGLSLKI